MSGPRILAIASAAGGCALAMVQDDDVLAAANVAAARGLPEAIPAAVSALMAGHAAPDLVAVLVGPGSFTGLRAGIAVAQGVALGAAVPVVGVTVREALEDTLPHLGGRELWVAIHARPGRVFLDCGGQGSLESVSLDAIPATRARIAVAGDAAIAVAGALAGRGVDVMLTSARLPQPRHVAVVGARRAAGSIPDLPAVPLYGDAPEAKLPAAGLRPAPV